MKNVEIVALGGCHVTGHCVGPDKAFPALLGKLLNGQVVAQVSHLQFVNLPQHLALVGALRPSHVVLQLGNHEFSASLPALLHQCRRAFIARPIAKKPAENAAPIGGSLAPPASPAACPAYHARVAVLSLLTAALWLLSAHHRRSFRALNACMRQYPETTFVFLSPFPCLAPADNALRDFGGWLLRCRLASLPNRHWIDSHRLLRADRKLFVDSWHLNKQAHRALAYSLAAAFLSNVDGLL